MLGLVLAVHYDLYIDHNKRNKDNKLTLCGKTNVLTYAFDLWERAFNELGEAEYADIQRDYAHVDATCMWMVKNPEWFDVGVTTNLFGDIITDLGAILQGGLGIAASGNIHPGRVSMFEPIHGSAPKYKGKNVSCPVATIAADPARSREIVPIVRPVIEKIASIVDDCLKKFNDLTEICLVGGTCELEGFDEIVQQSLSLRAFRPEYPQFITPLGIALSCLDAT